MYEVHVLQDGYSTVDEEGNMLANGTSTLIKGEKNIFVVDTMSPWDREKLKGLLMKHDVKPDNITHLVCTHGHPDHVGNNNLFTNAQQHIVGLAVYHGDMYYSNPLEKGENYSIDGENLVIMPTPGHTLDSISVKVKTTYGVVVVAGDLFEKEEDLKDPSIWKDAGSEDEVKQIENRKKVLQMADVVIPGHGGKFSVTEEMRKAHCL